MLDDKPKAVLVQLAVDYVFPQPGDWYVNHHGTKLCTVTAILRVPDEPSDRVNQLITQDKDGEDRILVDIGTTAPERTIELFQAMSNFGEQDFLIYPPNGVTKAGTPKQKGYMKTYPRPGDSGFDLPDEIQAVLDSGGTTDQASGDAEGSTGAAIAEPPAAPEQDGGGASSESSPVWDASASAPPPTPVELVTQAFDATGVVFADGGDWESAMVCFGAKSRAPIRVAFRKKFGKSIADMYGDADAIPLDVLETLMAEVG